MRRSRLLRPCSFIPVATFPIMAIRGGPGTFPDLHPSPCDRAAAPTPGSLPERACPTLARGFCLRSRGIARRSLVPPLPSGGHVLRRCSDFVMLQPGRSLPPWTVPSCDGGDSTLGACTGTVALLPMADWLHGCQAFTVAGPPPAGLRWLQAARPCRRPLRARPLRSRL